ncbi:MAG: hypothetical protein AAF682_08640 [Planctomycetota bacterium]
MSFRGPVRDGRLGREVPRSAHDELSEILRAEIATLLAEAAALRATQAPFGRFVGQPRESEANAFAWRVRARDALELWRDERAGDLHLLASIAALPETEWPGPTTLARAALGLDPTPRRRLALARALLAEGEAAAARAELVRVLDASPTPEIEWRACTLLARAHEQGGNDRLALGAADRAADVPGCGVEALVDSLFFALAVGDLRRAVRAGARLDLLLRPTAADLERALAELRLRVAVFRGGSSWRPAPATAELARALASGAGSSAERVAHAVLGDGA